MANEHNDQTQDLEQEQLEQAEAQSNAEVTVEDLTAQIAKLEESLKLEKARAANAVYEAEKVKERIEREADTAKNLLLKNLQKACLILSIT
jgi:molecular chaperone GrpE